MVKNEDELSEIEALRSEICRVKAEAQESERLGFIRGTAFVRERCTKIIDGELEKMLASERVFAFTVSAKIRSGSTP